jgi:hypothetical protein
MEQVVGGLMFFALLFVLIRSMSRGGGAGGCGT